MTNDTKTAETPTAAIARLEPFVVEFGDVYCRNHSISCLHVKVRGSWSVTRLHQRPEGGRDIGSAMATMPAVPGLRLRLLPREMKAYLEDPLASSPELLAAINAAAKTARSIYKGAPYIPVPTGEFHLTADLLKTLLLELHRKLEVGQLEIIEGRMPTLEAIAKLPGRELYDPWNQGRKPRYVDEVEGWQQRLDAQQGL